MILNPTRPKAPELSEVELKLLLDNLDQYSEGELVEIMATIEQLEENKQIASAYDDLIEFCKFMEPGYIVGTHHRILADLLMEIEQGTTKEAASNAIEVVKKGKDRVCVNIPPRHGKSHLVSTYFPAWFLGRNPGLKVMMVSHTTDLAVDFGRKVRNIIQSDQYRKVFPNVSLSIDSKSAGRWDTNVGGGYYATGVGSALAGRGADLLVIDDPHSEQDVLNGNYDVFDKAYDWFAYGARTRLMPGGRIAIVQTRWATDDLTGRVVRDMVSNEKADQYEVVEFPAILTVQDPRYPNDPAQKIEKALFPEFFSLDDLHNIKAGMPLFQWNAQYQQNPTSEEAAIVARELWKVWRKEKPPVCSYVIMTLDAAAEAKNRADFTAITTWGVFMNEEEDAHNIILLDSIKDRIEFPELKALALKEYKEREPDAFIVEKKSNGVPLYQELRRMGIPVQEYTPHRGSGDKMARLNSVADIIKSGLCWVPQTRWAEELVDEIASFPFGRNDDLVDTTIMALMRFRQGGFIRLLSDEPEQTPLYRRKRGYY